MEDGPRFEEEEDALEYNEAALPYFKEEKKELPKDYDATIERITAKLDQSETATNEGLALLGVGLTISVVLIITQLMEMMGYPKWLEVLHHLLIFAEATLPFFVSFFLKNSKHATVLRLVGIIVLLLYLFTLFA